MERRKDGEIKRPRDGRKRDGEKERWRYVVEIGGNMEDRKKRAEKMEGEWKWREGKMERWRGGERKR